MLLQVHFYPTPPQYHNSQCPYLHWLLLWHLHLIRQQPTPHNWWITSCPRYHFNQFFSQEIRKLRHSCTNKTDPGWLLPFGFYLLVLLPGRPVVLSVWPTIEQTSRCCSKPPPVTPQPHINTWKRDGKMWQLERYQSLHSSPVEVKEQLMFPYNWLAFMMLMHRGRPFWVMQTGNHCLSALYFHPNPIQCRPINQSGLL